MGGRSGIRCRLDDMSDDRCQMGMAAHFLNRFHWEGGRVLGQIERCMGPVPGCLNRLGREDRLGLSLVDLEYRSGLGHLL